MEARGLISVPGIRFAFARRLRAAVRRFIMARLEGKKPNAGAIIIGAIIFALIAAGLFFAFRPVPEPTDAGLSNSTESTPTEASSASNAITDESDNSLTTILTPLPLATPTFAPFPQATPDTTAPTDNNATAPIDDNAVPVPPPMPTMTANVGDAADNALIR